MTSRAVFLNMSERAIILHCASAKIGISTIGKLPTGGTRLVCMSVDGAEQIRRRLKTRQGTFVGNKRAAQNFDLFL
jgi:hypothetical protein